MRRIALAVATLLFATAAAPFDPFGEARIDEHPGAQVPITVPLIDETGTRTSLARLGGGRPIVLVPVLHDCPNLCGLTLDGLASAMRGAHITGDRQTAIVAFGIDPKEDSADARAALDRLAGRYPELAGHIHGTVASEAAVRAVTDALGYHFAYDPRIGQYAHASAVAVLTPDGRFSRWLYGIAPESAELSASLADARAGRTGGFMRQLILLCYHYDPETGRYGLAISWLLRAVCMLTVVSLLVYVLIARRGERNPRS